jgi:O-antigen/teichoic acid export membrane protein
MKLFSATLAGQILGTILFPFISRLYSPADFGFFQLFFSIVSLIAIISCFSYHRAIMLPEKDEDAAHIVVLCLILIIITTIISTVFLSFFSGYIEKTLNAPGLFNLILLFPLAIICNSVSYVLGFWVSRKEDFGTIARGNIYSSISGKAVSIGSGIISPSPFGLILGTIVNDATIMTVLAKKTFTDIHYFQSASYEKIKQLAYRYKKFPQYNAGANLASTAITQVIPVMLALFFLPVVVGYYAIAYMVIVLPSKLIGDSISTVFFQKASVEKNLTGSVKNIVQTVNTRLISVGMFICLIVMILGPELFSFALGAQWMTAGVYAQILAPWFFVLFISTPLFPIFAILEKQGASLWFNVSLLVATIVVIYIGGLLGDPILGMLLLSSTGIIFWSWMNMYLLKIAGVSVRRAIQEIIWYLVFGVSVCLPLLIAKYYSVAFSLLLIVAMAVTIIYYMVIVYRDTQLKEGLLYILGNILHK